MTENHFWELVNKELEQQLTSDEQHQLEKLLEDRPDLAARRKEILELPAMIEAAGQLDAPSSMKANIMSQLTALPGQDSTSDVRVTSGFRSYFSSLSLSDGFSFALGAAVCAIILLLVLNPQMRVPSEKNGRLVGTFIFRDLPDDSEILLDQAIDTLGVTGSVRFAKTGDYLLIDVNINSDGYSDLTIRFEPNDLSIVGVARVPDVEHALTVDSSECSFGGKGDYRCQLTGLRLKSESTPIWLDLTNENGSVGYKQDIPAVSPGSGSR